jgi:hypothetical protein
MKSSFVVILLLLVISVFHSTAQDQSTIFFYRPGGSGNVGYEVTDGSTSVGLLRQGTVFQYQCNAGDHEFTAKGKTLSSFRLNTEGGQEYFVLCGMANDSTQRPTFRLARKGEARVQIKKIDEVMASKISQTVLVTSADTVKALHHLFKRKRGWGIAFTIIGSLGVISGGAKLINYEPEQVPIGYGLTIEQDDRQWLVFGLINSIVLDAIGISRLRYYTRGRLDAILEDRAYGTPFPARVMKHLTKRDFVAP